MTHMTRRDALDTLDAGFLTLKTRVTRDITEEQLSQVVDCLAGLSAEQVDEVLTAYEKFEELKPVVGIIKQRFSQGKNE